MIFLWIKVDIWIYWSDKINKMNKTSLNMIIINIKIKNSDQ